jgi:hypothetical protein
MKWVQALKKAVKDYRDMVFNAHSVLKDYRSYEEINATPLRDVIEEIAYFTPKLKEIARQQEAERLKAELAGKRNMVKPGRKGGL